MVWRIINRTEIPQIVNGPTYYDIFKTPRIIFLLICFYSHRKTLAVKNNNKNEDKKLLQTNW